MSQLHICFKNREVKLTAIALAIFQEAANGVLHPKRVTGTALCNGVTLTTSRTQQQTHWSIHHQGKIRKTALIYYINYCYHLLLNSLTELKWKKIFKENKSSHSLTVSTLKTLKSKKSVFSRNSWFLSRRASFGPGIVPSGPCTENLNTVLNIRNTFRL